MFEVGDKVESKIYGSGIVFAVLEKGYAYPVRVGFKNGKTECYTQKGYYVAKDSDPDLSLK